MRALVVVALVAGCGPLPRAADPVEACGEVCTAACTNAVDACGMADTELGACVDTCQVEAGCADVSHVDQDRFEACLERLAGPECLAIPADAMPATCRGLF